MELCAPSKLTLFGQDNFRKSTTLDTRSKLRHLAYAETHIDMQEPRTLKAEDVSPTARVTGCYFDSEVVKTVGAFILAQYLVQTAASVLIKCAHFFICCTARSQDVNNMLLIVNLVLNMTFSLQQACLLFDVN